MAGSQRKAWNDAMRDATAAFVGATPSSLAGRRSDRNKKQARREQARKATSDGSSRSDARLHRIAAHMDVLEGVHPSTLEDLIFETKNDNEDEEYSEGGVGGGADSLSSGNSKGGGQGGSGKRKRNQTQQNHHNSHTTSSSVLVKGHGVSSLLSSSSSKRASNKTTKLQQFVRTSMASILMEEASRPYGVAQKYLAAEARPTGTYAPPPRKFCPVTGLFGIYTDPKSGIPYANLEALEQIRERAPPWMNYSGSASYFEAVQSLRGDEE